MPFRIVRNDITKMNTEAIVNTANDHATVGTGCDYAVYMAAGYEELLAYRKEHIGFVPEGNAFITPGFRLGAKYIIHAVSPFYEDGSQGEEEKLRSCYRKSLELAKEYHLKSISFPLISTGGFGYPKEEGMRIAIDEISAFLLKNEMQIYLVVFDKKATSLGEKLYPDLENYIDQNYVKEKRKEEYGSAAYGAVQTSEPFWARDEVQDESVARRERRPADRTLPLLKLGASMAAASSKSASIFKTPSFPKDFSKQNEEADQEIGFCEEDELEQKLQERMMHMSDSFSEYLLYLIKKKKMENAEVYHRAIVDKKIFSKIKNNVDYHPQKRTALCLCVGAMLNLDESKDLLERAGYALSPCDKTDIIFSYFIENGIYDMIELDIQLENHGLPCIIS